MDNTSNSKSGNEKSFFKTFKTIEELQVIFLGGIFLLILVNALYWAREIVIPFIIALLCNFLLTPSVRALQRLYIPAQIGAALVIMLVLFLIGSCIYGLTQPATAWLNKGPTAISDVNHKLITLGNSISAPFENLSKFGEMLSSFIPKPTQITTQTITPDKESFFVGTIAVTGQFLVGFATTIILLYFFLCYENYFLKKILPWMASLERKKEVVEISHEIQTQIFRYLFARTLINIGLAIAVSITMFILGMPDPILWGVMAGLLEFIPYIGALVSFIVIVVVALFSFVSVGYAFLVALLFFILVFLEANIVSPIVFGRTLTLNPILIFISLMFFTWIWGIAGTFVAVPMMVSIKIIVEMLESPL